MIWPKHNAMRSSRYWHTSSIDELYRCGGLVKVSMQRFAYRKKRIECHPKTVWLTEAQLRKEQNNIRKVVEE